MSSCLITDFRTEVVCGICWFNIRDMTNDDVIWSDWSFTKEMEEGGTTCSTRLYAESVAKAVPEVVDFSHIPYFDKMTEFNRCFQDPRTSGKAIATLSVDFSLRGIRREKHYLKVNAVRQQLIEKIKAEGEAARAAGLVRLNKSLKEFVDYLHREYIQSFVTFMSSLESYDLADLDMLAGTEDLVKRVAKVEVLLSKLEEELHEKRRAALAKDWEKRDERYPEEAQKALQETLTKGSSLKSYVRMKW